jgi:DNA polymerase I-like protein with 3'-5' exonuclease and polymerase domains
MKMPKLVTIDFETLGILSRPMYPPVPVGVSIKYPGKKDKYYGWGHATGNNCTYSEAKKALDEAWKFGDGLLMHQAKFDYDVARTHMDMPELPWNKVHDTVYLLFLNNPHQHNMSLKPSAELLLNMPPEEQDAVQDWLIENQPVPGVKISKSKTSEHYFGRYIAFAPGDLVGKYAEGDTLRTEKLFNLLYPKIVDAEMVEAYNRERKLMPIMLAMEKNGVPVDVTRLRADVGMYDDALYEIGRWLNKKLKVESGTVNFDSGAEVMEALIAAKLVDEAAIIRTPTGAYSTSKDSLEGCITDKTLLAIWKYRAQLNTCMRTFMRPWLAMAEVDGHIYTTWNQTKSTEGGGSIGTRTGRMSSTPNFQNIPNEFKPLFADEEKGLPRRILNLPPLPKVRGYVTAPKGFVLIGRDFSSQELRILAHFEGGAMADGYIKNPTTDLHAYAAELITTTTGVTITRKDAKNIAFAILYGSGNGALAMTLGCAVEEAKNLRNAYMNTFPGIKTIQSELKAMSKAGEPLVTFGGRRYYCEEPKVVNGRLMDFSYKMTNYLIQGSAADQTKDAVIRYWESGGFTRAPLILMVHDELVALARDRTMQESMLLLKDCMNKAGLDVPMVSDGEMGGTWSTMTEFI